MDCLAHLKELVAAPGVSGREAAVRDLIRAAWAPLATEVRVDRAGSLWAIKTGAGKAPRHTIMLAAHMDAIGLMVKQVEADFLRITAVGGIDARILPGQLVTVHGREDLPGVVIQPPAFALPKENREGVVPLAEMLIDTGLPAAELAARVTVGDVISFTQPPRDLPGELLAAPNLDNRASVTALTLCLEHLQNRRHAWDVVAVATTQEEETLRGARTSAFALHPDLAVVVDVTQASGPNSKDFPDKTFTLGDGPTIGLGPNIHPRLYAAVQSAAARLEITCPVEPLAQHSGTDAIAIQVVRAGIPTAVLGLPLRNMHTPVEVTAIKDIQRTARLLAEFIAGLSADFMDTLALD